MKIGAKAIVEDLLVSEEMCLGAVFCTYTFDPSYFEEHVLRCLLRLRGDPREDGSRYHHEALQALQATPVACIVDASVRQGGRRLPYDLHLVRSRTFHPKVYVVLYESEARLAVGSGNLTKSGLEQNTELFFVRTLRYDEPEAAQMLRDVDTFLGDCYALANGESSQLVLIRRALSSRLAPERDKTGPPDVAFVSTVRASLVDTLRDALPADAKITRVGVLAPFFEEDDLDAGRPESGLDGALAAVLALRPSSKAVLDIGVLWEDAPVSAPATHMRRLLDADSAGLWAWRRRESAREGALEGVTYVTITRVGAARVDGVAASGATCRLSRRELEQDAESGRLWRVSTPQVHAPKHILHRIAAERTTTLWLHPAADLSADGRARRRPLHAKVVLITVVHRGALRTYGYFGSANASRGALVRSVARGGNVEAGVVVRFKGEVTLPDVLPSLVWHHIEGVDLLERASVPRAPDLSAWIDEVVYDAGLRTLRVAWSSRGPATLESWSICYLDRQLAVGVGPPESAVVAADFDLDAASAEVTFSASGSDWLLPIRILDLAALPVGRAISSLSLQEVLALLGGRVSLERLSVLAARSAPADASDVLALAFGEDFGPTDVFRAWWGGAEDLVTSRSVPAFRLRLLGPTGLRAAWCLLREVPASTLSSDEVWIYGCELLRELRGLTVPPGPDAPEKDELVRTFEEELVKDLGRLTPSLDQRSWLEDVVRFYGIGVSDGSA